MNQLLILCQSDADASNLAAAGQYVLSHGVRAVWLLISPQVVVPSEAASAKFDQEIAELRAQEAAAVAAKKYGEAEQFSKAVDVKMLDKAGAVLLAYKDLPAEELTKRMQALVKPLFEVCRDNGINFKSQGAKEHYEVGNFVNFLNAYLPAKPPGFEPGNFGVVWASALSDQKFGFTIPKQQENSPLADQALETAKKAVSLLTQEKPKFDPAAKRTLNELEALSFMALKSVGNYHGVYVPGMKKEDLIRDIDKKQQMAA